jgi:YVTN family beta-propeller protein
MLAEPPRRDSDIEEKMRARPGLSAALVAVIAMSACEVAYYPYFTRVDPGVLWISNSADNTVSCIDRIDDKIIGTYPVGKNPSRTAVDLAGNCWVGSRDEATVYFVTPTGTTKRFDTVPNPRGIALDRAGDVWVASSTTPTIQRIGARTGEVSASISIVSGTNRFYGALVDSEGYYWILDQDGQRMVKYDTSKFPDPGAVTTIPILNPIYGFTIDQDGTVWIAGNSTNFLNKIPNGSTSPQQISLAFSGICAVTFDILGKIWITNDGANQVLRYDPATGGCVAFPVNGSNPHGLGSDENGYIYAVNRGSNNVSKIDCRTGTVVTQYAVGHDPYIYSDLTGFVYRTVTRK